VDVREGDDALRFYADHLRVVEIITIDSDKMDFNAGEDER